MRDEYLKEGMRVVFENLGIDPDTPYSIEPVRANLWLSAAYRIKVEKPGLSFFVKRFSEDIQCRTYFDCPIFFANEAAAYMEVLTEFYKFQKQQGLEKPVTFTPKCLYTMCDGENDIIILEDLNVDGFHMPDRKKKFSLDNLSLLMTTMGKFHALSLAMKNKDPQRFQHVSSKVKETIWSEEHFGKTSDNIFTKFGIKVHNILREQLDPEHSRKLEKLSSRNGNVLQEVSMTDPSNEPWNVVTHGDLWVSNILLSADSTSMRLVDFQQCRYASPALDVSSVLFLCMDGPMRTDHADDLIRLYHKSLCDFLSELGSNSDIFPYSKLKEQLIKYGQYGLGISFLNIPHSMNDGDDGDLQADNGTSVRDAVEKECNICSDACKQRLLDNIRHAAIWGYI